MSANPVPRAEKRVTGYSEQLCRAAVKFSLSEEGEGKIEAYRCPIFHYCHVGHS
jgi:hypothetical protein